MYKCFNTNIAFQHLIFDIVKMKSTISTYNLPITDGAISWLSFRININLALLRLFPVCQMNSFNFFVLFSIFKLEFFFEFPNIKHSVFLPLGKKMFRMKL